jgi:formylmethanofuran dehydrogenase subunit C
MKGAGEIKRGEVRILGKNKHILNSFKLHGIIWLVAGRDIKSYK